MSHAAVHLDNLNSVTCCVDEAASQQGAGVHGYGIKSGCSWLSKPCKLAGPPHGPAHNQGFDLYRCGPGIYALINLTTTDIEALMHEACLSLPKSG